MPPSTNNQDIAALQSNAEHLSWERVLGSEIEDFHLEQCKRITRGISSESDGGFVEETRRTFSGVGFSRRAKELFSTFCAIYHAFCNIGWRWGIYDPCERTLPISCRLLLRNPRCIDRRRLSLASNPRLFNSPCGCGLPCYTRGYATSFRDYNYLPIVINDARSGDASDETPPGNAERRRGENNGFPRREENRFRLFFSSLLFHRCIEASRSGTHAERVELFGFARNKDLFSSTVVDGGLSDQNHALVAKFHCAIAERNATWFL